ncbi:MAG: amino acid adenylation domain-containing protein, partial [Acidobacteria bacterium]|nr:amino acid adenylation domain-containing protein [Acidobacteriota bacterium]
MTNDYFYRTGDLARWLSDGPPAGGASGGVIEYLGRIDFQVKIRGFRIELEEIEAHLVKYQSIEKAVVIDRQEDKENGEKYLCAYIVSKEKLDISLLRNYLAQRLPEYMIPAFFVPLEQIPLTPNGKVNRKALPAPNVTAGETYIAPGNKIEEKLAEIWAEILNLKKEAIGVNHSFFELGGHSLKATVLAARIHKELDIKLPVLEIFRNQTIRQLSGYISRVKPTEKFAAIGPSEKKEYYVLSSVQRRLYFIFQLEKNSTNYNMPDIIPMKGEVDSERMEEVFDQLIRRHESFRTSFHLLDQEPVQKVHDEVEFKITQLGNLEQAAEARIDQILQEFIKPFDLSCAPLLRVGLLKKSSGNHILLVDIHHIIMDAVSMEVLKEEFFILYAGKQESLPMLNLQYKDYSEWQQRERVKGMLKNQEKFWLENLAGELPVLRLPLDFSRPLVQGFEGNTVDFQLAEKEVQQLKKLAYASGSTLYILLLSLFNLLLFKLSDQQDIIVGTVMAARRHSDLQRVIGMFVNTLAVRNFPCAEKTSWEFLTEVRQNILALYENQDYPFEDIVEKIDISRDTSRNPIFDVLFTMQNPIEKENLTEYASFGYESKLAKFDITLGAAETDENLTFSLNYCTLLFKQETIDRFIIYFMNIVSSILLEPYQEISNVDMLTKKEKQQLLIEFNDNAKSCSLGSSLYELFELQVQKSPDHIALIGKNICGCPVMTYRELNERANHLAGKLYEKGVYADAAGIANSIAAIMVERSFETIIGILGILKVGGVYLPIDPLYPKERIEYMLIDSGVQILVGNRHADSMELNCHLPIVNCELMNGSAAFFQHSAPFVHPSRHLIYIIYTSGTIGKPKGAAVYHDGFLNLMHWFITGFGLNSKDRNLLLTSLSFDLTQKNIFAPLVTGGALIFPPQDYFDHYGILQCIEEKQLTWFNCTPGMLAKLIEYCSDEDLKKLVSLRYVFLGGEPIIMKVLRKWTTSSYFRAGIVNTYGPTECADISSYYAIENPWTFNEQNVPIGKPIYNVNLYILNRWFQLLPLHVPGDIFVGGQGVGAGYLNRPELTHEKFRPLITLMPQMKNKNNSLRANLHHSSFDIPRNHHSKLYRTGDFARWLPDGNIEFLGRIDQQVKIRGFRIELGEIEAQLVKNDSLKEVVVLDRAEENGEKYLCAYIVMAKGLQLDSTALKQYLAGRLPDYMIPAYFVPIEKIPMTAHGKVDRRALPEPLILLEKDYEAPKSELEDKIVDIWSEVLGIEKTKISV